MLRMVSKVEALKRRRDRYRAASTAPSSAVLELPELHAGQLEVYGDHGRFNVLACGRRWGKTVLGTRLLLEPAREGFPTAWFAPTYKLLEEVMLGATVTLLPILKRRDLNARRLELTNGGVVEFWTLDDPITVARGRKYKRVVIDEAAMAAKLSEAWQQAIRPTLTDYIGDAWFLSTPKGDNEFKRMFDLGTARTSPEWRAWSFPTASNPYISGVEIEAARADPNLPEIVFRQEYLAEFVSGDGTRVRREWLKTLEPPANLEVTMGVDLAISTKADADYTACVVLGRDASSGKLWVLHAERIRAPFYAVLQFIQRVALQWKPRAIGIEQVQYQAAVVQELLRNTNLPVQGIRPDRDKITRFQPLEARYEQGLVYHAPNLEPAFERELLAFPLGNHDDMVDALAYAHRVLGQSSSFTVRGGSAG